MKADPFAYLRRLRKQVPTAAEMGTYRPGGYRPAGPPMDPRAVPAPSTSMECCPVTRSDIDRVAKQSLKREQQYVREPHRGGKVPDGVVPQPPRDRVVENPAVPPGGSGGTAGRFYGGTGTIHGTEHLNVETHDGTVVAVWFRCQMLPFDQIDVGAEREVEMRAAMKHAPALVGVTVCDLPHAPGGSGADPMGGR